MASGAGRVKCLADDSNNEATGAWLKTMKTKMVWPQPLDLGAGGPMLIETGENG